MAKEALKLWMGLPADTRRMLLSNVWCGECLKAVSMCDYNADFDGGVVVLRGFCGTCGHKVARVLDERGGSSKKTPKCALRYYIFDIWIWGTGGVGDFKDKVLRRIQIAETKSLYNFAKVIVGAFGFQFDHCFGFYSNFEKYYDSAKMYEFFVDIGEERSRPWVKGVKNTRISQPFKNPGDKMHFLFDYGDCWHFAVELKEIKQAEKWDLKPVILESIGKAPLQYPPCEDEIEEDDHNEK